MNMTLYQLTDQYQRIAELSESEEGDAESLKMMLDDIVENINSKILSLGAVIKNLSAEQETIEKEIGLLLERLIREKEKREKRIDGIKEYIRSNMNIFGFQKISGVSYDVSLRRNPPRVEIVDEDKIPSEFFRERILRSPDKDKIKYAMDKLNQDVDGCKMVYAQSVVIK